MRWVAEDLPPRLLSSSCLLPNGPSAAWLSVFALATGFLPIWILNGLSFLFMLFKLPPPCTSQSALM